MDSTPPKQPALSSSQPKPTNTDKLNSTKGSKTGQTRGRCLILWAVPGAQRKEKGTHELIQGAAYWSSSSSAAQRGHPRPTLLPREIPIPLLSTVPCFSISSEKHRYGVGSKTLYMHSEHLEHKNKENKDGNTPAQHPAIINKNLGVTSKALVTPPHHHHQSEVDLEDQKCSQGL